MALNRKVLFFVLMSKAQDVSIKKMVTKTLRVKIAQSY